MCLHHLVVATHSRTRLCLAGREGVYLGSRLVYEGQQHVEGYIVSSQQVVGSGIHGVGEVAGKHGGYVQQGTTTRISVEDHAGQATGQRLNSSRRLL